MAIPNPNPNIADGIKSDNKTYSSNKIESLVAEATELPTPEAGDAGKVLTVNSDADGYELDAIPAELPTTAAGDSGKVLTVNSDGDGYELAYAGHDLIDDDTASADTVYSSSKVDTLLGAKQNAATALKCVIVQGTLTNSVTIAGNSQTPVFDNVDIKNGNVFSSMAVGTLADIPDNILGASLIWNNTGVCIEIAFLPHSGSTISLSVRNLTSDSQTITGTRLMIFGY